MATGELRKESLSKSTWSVQGTCPEHREGASLQSARSACFEWNEVYIIGESECGTTLLG